MDASTLYSTTAVELFYFPLSLWVIRLISLFQILAFFSKSMSNQVPFLHVIEDIMLSFAGRGVIVYEMLHINLLNRMNDTGFPPWRVHPHRVRPHELIPNFVSMHQGTRNKHVLCGFVSSRAQSCLFFFR